MTSPRNGPERKLTRMIARNGSPANPQENENFISLTDPRILTDHLRLPIKALRLGEAAQVLAAIARVASERQGFRTFVSNIKLAAVACMPLRVVERAVGENGPLVRGDWIQRLGRQRDYVTGRPRRTVTLWLSEAGYGRYLSLPRAPLCQWKLTWGERLLLAFIVSRHTLTEFLGKEQKRAVDRRWFTLGDIQAHTGLARNTVRSARRRLTQRGIIEWTQFPDGQTHYKLTGMLNANALPPTVANVIKSKPPKRKPAKRKPPKLATTATTTDVPKPKSVPTLESIKEQEQTRAKAMAFLMAEAQAEAQQPVDNPAPIDPSANGFDELGGQQRRAAGVKCGGEGGSNAAVALNVFS